MKMTNVYSYIRWSSDRQTWGDSERRQEQMAKDWCARKGLKLSQHSFADRGTSAWKGRNLEDGALAELLRLVKPGDVILIEDNDRLSRQDAITAMGNLRKIVNKDVTVVFLKTGVEVTSRNYDDPSVLIPNFFHAYLANAENEKKSFRGKAVWAERKRQVIEEHKPIRQKLPSWLDWDETKDRPVVIERNAAVVRRMFKLALQGHGVVPIARLLKDTPPISRNPGKGWSGSYVWLTLNNRSVLGYCTHVDPPVPGIYPPIVSEKIFYAVQAKLAERKHLTAPVRHVNANLFTGVCRCWKCGGALMRHVQKRPRGKAYPYLVCSAARQGTSLCRMTGIRYEPLEQSFISLLAHGDLVRAHLADGGRQTTVLDTLKGKLMEMDKQAKKIERLIIDDDNPPRTLVARLKQIELQQRELGEQVEIESAKVNSSTPPLVSYETFRDEFAQRMGQTEFRSWVRQLIRDMTEKIVVELGSNRYWVHFKGAKRPIEVQLHPMGGWLFNPAPRWLLDPQSQEMVAAVLSA